MMDAPDRIGLRSPNEIVLTKIQWTLMMGPCVFLGMVLAMTIIDPSSPVGYVALQGVASVVLFLAIYPPIVRFVQWRTAARHTSGTATGIEPVK